MTSLRRWRRPPQRRVLTGTFLADLCPQSGDGPEQQEGQVSSLIHVVINVVTYERHPSWSWRLPEMFLSQSHRPAPALRDMHARVVQLNPDKDSILAGPTPVSYSQIEVETYRTSVH